LALVELGNLLQHFDRLLIFASVDQELGGLLEVENNEAQEEDGKRYGAQCEHQVAPSHVTCPRTTGCSGWDISARWCRIWFDEVGRAAVGRDEAVCDDAADNHADGLEQGE